ncbi:sugar transporter [Coprobacter tertius]|uniref:Sugar transporter n=1 Tax=Coprobacter tertius TaxID=2944915 RepID=A0ABT1ME55_9BACT|nr:sugar transporter [Coprobacter tertius]MCP9610908.1 sugar transporter [Coprobacter tertius]
MSVKSWFPLIGLTCAAFIFNTSEFIPIGLLSDIAKDFKITEAHAGLLISVYAWIVTLLSLPLILLVSKIELRKLLLFTLVLFVGFQVFSSVSANYGALMASRIGVACTHSVFWSIVSPLAVRIVPDKNRPLALSMIVTGTSVAMILGLPLGRIIGLHIGWRMAFLCVGVFAFITFLYLIFVLPKVPSHGGFSLHRLPVLLKNKLLVGLYLLSFAIATSYYTGYSYIEPFLKQVAGLKDSWITSTLMIFGGAGILGSLFFSKYYGKYPYAFVGIVIFSVSFCLILIYPFSFNSYLIILLCAFWGMAVTAFNVAMQAEIINNSPQSATPVSMSIFSGIFNLGIGCGTLIGGGICTYSSISYIGYVGGILAALAFIYWQKKVLKQLKNRKVIPCL